MQRWSDAQVAPLRRIASVLQSQGGYADWAEPTGWWLDRRIQSIAARG